MEVCSIEGQMDEPNDPTEGAWPVGWDGHERAQLLRMAAWPLPLKLRWLEEAQAVVEHLRSQWKHAPGGSAPSSGTPE